MECKTCGYNKTVEQVHEVRMEKILEELQEEIIRWANKWGYKGVAPECITELQEIMKCSGLTDSEVHNGVCGVSCSACDEGGKDE